MAYHSSPINVLWQDLLAAIIGDEQPGHLYPNDLKPAAKDGAAFANVLDRFLDIVRTLVGIGFYVVLDCQLQQDALSQACSASIMPEHAAHA